MKSGPIAIDIAACTDVGLVRKNNEDSYITVDLLAGQSLGDLFKGERTTQNLSILLAVSDGMGGKLAGEVASDLTVNTLKDQLLRSKKLPPYERLVQAVEEANYQVHQEGLRPEFRGMGATLTAVLVENDTAYVAEVGDSRAYLIREGRIKQVTTDQSLIEVMLSRGLISPIDAQKSSNKGILLQAIGSKEDLQVAVTSFPLQSNDYLLLCSDGLSNKVKGSELLQFITQRGMAQPACQDMIVAARHRGGEDNITALVARFNGSGLPNKVSSGKITTTLQALSTFDPDRPKPKRRTQTMLSVSASKALVYPSTVGISAPARDIKDYPQLDELVAEFERLSYHLDKAAESLHLEMGGLRQVADWIQQGGAIDKRLPEIFTKLRSAEATLEQTSRLVGEAKESFKDKIK